jgi:hypothetical protein
MLFKKVTTFSAPQLSSKKYFRGLPGGCAPSVWGFEGGGKEKFGLVNC